MPGKAAFTCSTRARRRLIVDDLLIDAPDKSLLALARHPKIDIRIYNPQTSVGVPLHKRLLNVLTDFRGVNQRMHDKTLVVDGKIAITGGRNMAAEYFDYNHECNFRDRDVLLLGEAVKAMRASFERFWNSELSVKVEELYGSLGAMQKYVRVNDAEIEQIYRELHAYAKAPENFAPEVRAAVIATPESFARLAQSMKWGKVDFISDRPGKNENQFRLDGGGETASALGQLIKGARARVVIQSPYLVLSDRAMELFRQITARGVTVRINTNSLASTDNLAAFSGYRNQRDQLLKMRLQILRVQAGAGRVAQADAALSNGDEEAARLCTARQDHGGRFQDCLYRHVQLRPALGEPEYRSRRDHPRRDAGTGGGGLDRDRHGAGQQLGRRKRRPGPIRFACEAEQGAAVSDDAHWASAMTEAAHQTAAACVHHRSHHHRGYEGLQAT